MSPNQRQSRPPSPPPFPNPIPQPPDLNQAPSQLSNLAQQLKSQWLLARPKAMRRLEAAGQLDQFAEEAAEQVLIIQQQCQAAGMQPHEANEVAMQSVLLPDL